MNVAFMLIQSVQLLKEAYRSSSSAGFKEAHASGKLVRNKYYIMRPQVLQPNLDKSIMEENRLY